MALTVLSVPYSIESWVHIRGARFRRCVGYLQLGSVRDFASRRESQNRSVIPGYGTYYAVKARASPVTLNTRVTGELRERAESSKQTF